MGNEIHAFVPDADMTGADLQTPQAGPSWQRNNWPLTGGASEDDLTQALDPMAIKPAIAAAAKQAGKPMSSAQLEEAAADSIRAMILIRTFRVRGHLAANLDPLGIARQDLPADLTPEFHGFSGAALDRKVFMGGVLGVQWATVNEIVAILRANYCGKVGLEYMHIADVEERKFWKDYMHAYEQALSATSNKHCPWYVVPADDKENARLIVSQIIVRTLEGLKMSYPPTDAARRRELKAIRARLVQQAR